MVGQTCPDRRTSLVSSRMSRYCIANLLLPQFGARISRTCSAQKNVPYFRHVKGARPPATHAPSAARGHIVPWETETPLPTCLSRPARDLQMRTRADEVDRTRSVPSERQAHRSHPRYARRECATATNVHFEHSFGLRPQIPKSPQKRGTEPATQTRHSGPQHPNATTTANRSWDGQVPP